MQPISPVSPAQKFVHWCRSIVLPFWAENAWDSDKGGFFEQFYFDGRPDRNTPRRVRVAARQIYSFSHAQQLGWLDQRGLILNGVDWLMDKAWRRDGEPGFIHLVDDAGNPIDRRRDLYDHAFHILGLSWAYQATKDTQVLGLAHQTLAYVDEALSSAAGGWNEDDQGTLPRRQNPHMHMFEALMALYQASKDPQYLVRADQIATLLTERFMDQETGNVLEFFDQNWNAAIPKKVEPGHMAEWFWLLHTRKRLGGAGSQNARPANLLRRAEELGQQDTGFFIEACTMGGTPTTDTCRLWAQSEWLKAALAEHEADHTSVDKIHQLIDRLFAHYLKADTKGLWFDTIATNGEMRSTRVPASILYHLISAAAEVERVCLHPKKEI